MEDVFRSAVTVPPPPMPVLLRMWSGQVGDDAEVVERGQRRRRSRVAMELHVVVGMEACIVR